MARLGKHLKFLMVTSKKELCFIVQEEHDSRGAEKAVIPQSVIEGMISERRFKMKIISVKISSRMSVSDIFLCVAPGEMNHISGFPRSLVLDETTRTGNLGVSQVAFYTDHSAGNRPVIADSTHRWAGRSHSQRSRDRNSWVPPFINAQDMSDVISMYSSPNYVLGNLPSESDLRASASRLSTRSTAQYTASIPIRETMQSSLVEMDATQQIYELE
jgi:hypothetical protein